MKNSVQFLLSLEAKKEYMHFTPAVLSEKIRQASTPVVGELYYHYRDPFTHYRVIALGLQEVDEAVCVIYQNVQHPDLVWVRNVASWNECALINGKPEPRFRFVQKIA